MAIVVIRDHGLELECVEPPLQSQGSRSKNQFMKGVSVSSSDQGPSHFGPFPDQARSRFSASVSWALLFGVSKIQAQEDRSLDGIEYVGLDRAEAQVVVQVQGGHHAW